MKIKEKTKTEFCREVHSGLIEYIFLTTSVILKLC